jgi:hypothetical protein
MSSTKVKIIKTPSCLKIYLDSKMHLFIKSEVIAIHSWIDESKNRLYKIEYSVKDKSILTEYVDIKIWSEILKQLDKIYEY